MSSLAATATALAGRFTGVTATVGSGSEALVDATARLPNAIAAGPILLVYPPVGVLEVVASKLRRDEHDFPVRLMRDPLSVPERTDALYAWYDALRDRVESNMDLDLAYVAWARPISSRLELDGQVYAGSVFDVVELIVRVHFNEAVTTLAI